MIVSHTVWSPCGIHDCKFQIPSTKPQAISKLQSPKQVTRLMVGVWFIDVSLELGF
jgi:hypothetical protein